MRQKQDGSTRVVISGGSVNLVTAYYPNERHYLIKMLHAGSPIGPKFPPWAAFRLASALMLASFLAAFQRLRMRLKRG